MTSKRLPTYPRISIYKERVDTTVVMTIVMAISKEIIHLKSLDTSVVMTISKELIHLKSQNEFILKVANK